MEYIDIHSHIVFGVDDGSKSLEQSIKYLHQAAKYNVKTIVATPHTCRGSKKDLIKKKYDILKKEANKLNIKLLLGNEILYNDKICELLENKKYNTINNTNYVLVEFKRNKSADTDTIISMLDEISDEGYNVILAHPELYKALRSIEFVRRLKEEGIMVQIDASSLSSNRSIKNYCKKLLKEKLVDIVASDCHCSNKRNFKYMMKAYKKIKNKYGTDYAEILFYKNPSIVIGGNNNEEK